MTEDFYTPRDDAEAEDGRDARLADALRSLDPETSEPGYWYRFHARVMAGGRDELARRRMLADVTVGDLVASWARMLVPTAVLAAALASLLLMRPDGPMDPRGADVPVALEDLLHEEIGDAETVLGIEQTMGVTFASGSF